MLQSSLPTEPKEQDAFRMRQMNFLMREKHRRIDILERRVQKTRLRLFNAGRWREYRQECAVTFREIAKIQFLDFATDKLGTVPTGDDDDLWERLKETPEGEADYKRAIKGFHMLRPNDHPPIKQGD